MIRSTILALAFPLLLASAALCQQGGAATPTPAAATAPRAEAATDYVEAKGFKNKIFEVKSRDPRELMRAIEPLSSGFRGATMTWNDEFKTITVRDFPENIAVIEEALNRLDKPAPAALAIEFHVHILVASNAAGEHGETPAELSDVIRQLRSTLPYKSYVLVSSSVERTNDGNAQNRGTVDGTAFGDNAPSPSDHTASYEYKLARISHKGVGDDSGIQIGNFSFNMRLPRSQNYGSVGFDTPVAIRNGEKVVVGSSTVSDKAVIVVVIASPVK